MTGLMEESIPFLIGAGVSLFWLLFIGVTVVLLIYYLVKKINREEREDFEKRDN